MHGYATCQLAGRGLLLMAPLFLLCGLSEAGAANLLTNGGFEKGLQGWHVTKPDGARVEIVPGVRGNCARLWSDDRSGSTYLIQGIDPQRIRGKRLRVEALVKAEGVVLGVHSYSQAKIALVWNDGKRDHEQEVDFLHTFDWRRISVAWEVGGNCEKATLYLGMHTTTGTVWLDDVSVTAPELKSERPVAEGVQERIYDDGRFLRVGGRDFQEMKRMPSPTAAPFQPTREERSRGFVVARPEEPSTTVPGSTPSRREVADGFRLAAAPDQYEPLSFTLFALNPLKEVTVTPGNLAGPGGAVIPAAAFDARMGRHVIQRVGYTGHEYHVVPKLLVKCAPVSVSPERPHLYWLTLHVPPDAAPGEYRGAVRVEADGKAASLPVGLRVLPFRLAPSKPWMLYFYNDQPRDAETYFRDMREHGMTSVILACVQEALRREGDRAVMDFSKADAFVQAYRKAGFTDPLVYNPFHDRLATRLLELWGLADRYPQQKDYGERICVFQEGEFPAHLQEAYRDVVRQIHDHARQAEWPPTIYYPVDEPNEPTGWRMAAARMEYRLTREVAPKMRTFCTVYSLPIMERLDPWLDVRACHIIPLVAGAEQNRAFHDYLGRAGGEIWGVEWPAMWDDFWRARELAGFLPAKAGVTAMTAWTYYNPGPFAEPYNDLRGEFKRCLFVYRDADGSLIPTLPWEGIRAGVTDWRYLATLEQAAARATGKRRERAERALREAIAAVPWRSDPPGDWGNRAASRLREKITEAILDCTGAQ